MGDGEGEIKDGITVGRLSYLDTREKSSVYVYSTLYMSSPFMELTQLQIDVVLKIFDLGMTIQVLISQKQIKIAII